MATAIQFTKKTPRKSKKTLGNTEKSKGTLKNHNELFLMAKDPNIFQGTKERAKAVLRNTLGYNGHLMIIHIYYRLSNIPTNFYRGKY